MTKEARLITASHLVRCAGCTHNYYLDCFGEPSLKRPESDAERFVKEQGQNFQKELLDQLSGLQKVSSYDSASEGFSLTRRWMEEGVPLISQGMLLRGGYCGIPDVLKKISGPSNLGSYTYIPVEIKSHKTATYYDRLQLCFYSFLLEPLLGYRPETGVLIGSGGTPREISLTGKIYRQFSDLMRQMEEIRAGTLQTQALRCAACSRCVWSRHCSQQWQEHDHVSLLSGLNASMARKLAGEGLTTCRQVAELTPEVLSDVLGVPVKACKRFVTAAKARTENRPIILKEPVFPGAERPVYFYDIETCDEQVFCHAVIRMKGTAREERCFFSESLGEERENWHRLLEFFTQDENPLIYCWTYYERSFVESLWQKYGGNEKAYRVLRNNLFDQCAFVREHFALPCRGYSIKAVAPFFGFRWSAEDANGMNCVAWYRSWLASGDEALRRKIMEYNLDDVRAMAVVDSGLKSFLEG